MPILLILLTVGCEKEPQSRSSVPIGAGLGITANTAQVHPEYGAVVPMTFTVENLTGGTCRLKSLEALVGGRWEMWTGPAEGVPIPAGESFRAEVPYRLLTTQEDVLLTYEPSASISPETGSGRVVRERARVSIACPEEPFDSGRLERRFDAWTFSTALGGFIYRGNEWTLTLVKRDGASALPPLPFRLLMDVDRYPKGVTVLMDNEEIRRLTAPELQQFLSDLRARRACIQVSREPGRATYQVLR